MTMDFQPTSPTNRPDQGPSYQESELAHRMKGELAKLGFVFDENEKLIYFDDVMGQQQSDYKIGDIIGGQRVKSDELGSIQKQSFFFLSVEKERKVEDRSTDGTTGPGASLRGGQIRQTLRVDFYDDKDQLVKRVQTIFSFTGISFRKHKDMRVKQLERVMTGLKNKGKVTTMYENGQVKSVTPELSTS